MALNPHNIDHQPNFIVYAIYDLMEGYNEALDADPILTKACTSATVYCIGDIIAQRSEGAEHLDYPRIFRSLLAGFIGHGPLSHVWYNFCEDVFVWLGWNDYWWVPFPKVIFDQTTWAPFWNNVYIILLGVMRCQTWRTIWADIRRTTLPLIVSGLKLWPAAHVITYGYIRVENRLLWVDIVEILWVTILATQAAGKQKQHRRMKKLVAEAAAANREDDLELSKKAIMNNNLLNSSSSSSNNNNHHHHHHKKNSFVVAAINNRGLLRNNNTENEDEVLQMEEAVANHAMPEAATKVQ